MLIQRGDFFSVRPSSRKRQRWRLKLGLGGSKSDISECVWKLVRLFGEQTLQMARTLDAAWNRKAHPTFMTDWQPIISISFLHRVPFLYIFHSDSGLKKEAIFPDSDFFQYLISRCLFHACVHFFFNTEAGSPMGLQSCKPYNCCLQSKEECRAADVCPYVCEDWRYCSDRCCDVCCQMCVDLCSGLCSGDCSYTFCTICLALVQNCLLRFTARQSETSEARSK